MTNGKLYLTGSVGLDKKFGPLDVQITLIDVKVSASNCKRVAFRALDHINPFAIKANQSNYGISDYRNYCPIKIDTNTLKKSGDIS